MHTLPSAQTKIRKYFEFLFQKGYTFKEYDFPQAFDNWVVLLQSGPMKIMIVQDRGEIDLRLAPGCKRKTNDNRHYMDLETLIALIKANVSYQYSGNISYDTDEQMKMLSTVRVKIMPKSQTYFKRAPSSKFKMT